MTTSHPHVDASGTMWNVGTAYDPKKGYSYAVVKYEKADPEWSGTMMIENGRTVCGIPARHKHSPAYFHSFGMTEDYVAFVEQPLFVDDVRNGMGGAGQAMNSQSLRWRKTEMVIRKVQLNLSGNSDIAFLTGMYIP